MNETKKMRAILRERGIEYRDVNSMVTDVEHDGIKTRVYDYDDGPDHQLCVEQNWLTAEEAVRVALGIKPQEVLERRVDELCAEVERLRKYTKTLESANLDVTARLQDYIGQYDPTGAFVSEVKAENAKLRELNEAMWLIIRCAASHTSAEDGLPVIHEDDLAMLRSMRRELGNQGGLMNTENDLAFAYHMGYDDALAKRKPDASKTQVLAPYDLATENAKLREYLQMAVRIIDVAVEKLGYNAHPDELEKMHKEMRELGIEVQ